MARIQSCLTIVTSPNDTAVSDNLIYYSKIRRGRFIEFGKYYRVIVVVRNFRRKTSDSVARLSLTGGYDDRTLTATIEELLVDRLQSGYATANDNQQGLCTIILQIEERPKRKRRLTRSKW